MIKSESKVAVIGAGNMGEALLRGILRAKKFPPKNIIVAEPREKRRREISRELGIRVTPDNRAAVRFADIVVLAVKPQVAGEVLSEISAELDSSRLLISIMAGVPTTSLEVRLTQPVPVIRVMPNTPALVQAGVAAICGGRHARKEHLKRAEELMNAVGRVVRFPEEMMNRVTAISGSGPAYLYLFTEALSEAAQELGIGRKWADILAVETLIGSGKLLEKTGESPAELRKKVTSKGGTTEAALKVLQAGGMKKLIKEAVRAADLRGEELGKSLKPPPL